MNQRLWRFRPAFSYSNRRLGLATCVVLFFAAYLPVNSVTADESYLPDVDLPGYVFRNFDLPRPRPRLCESACQNDKSCRAWTFVRVGVLGPVASCFLKNQVPKPRPDDCCVSGVIR
jgi:hypothetical protein